MRFLPTDEQLAFAEAVDDIVSAHGGAAVARAWGAGDTASGLALLAQFAETGLMGLRISEDDGGFDGTPSDLVVVFERLGWHGVPGPLLETIVLLPRLVDETTRQAIAAGEAIVTAAVDPIAPFALDAAIATHRYLITGGTIAPASIDEQLESLDPARRIASLTADGTGAPLDADLLAAAIDETTLACAAILVGAGERMLSESVAYAKVREQFGQPIGEYQAVKHQLADVRVALSFARPLVQGAALSLGSADGPRDVSAAKVAAGDAALLAARVALQVHGAIGYTEEHDLGIWITKATALDAAWGSTDYHRARIARAILER